MIGPASRAHFVKALQHAGRAEFQVNNAGGSMSRVEKNLARAQVELLKGIAFAFLEGEVSVKGEGE